MTTKIIHTGRAGPDKARQRRTEPGRDGKGRTGPDSARQVQAGSGSAEQCWTAPNRTGMSHEGSVIAGRGRERPEMVGRTGQERKGSVRQCRARRDRVEQGRTRIFSRGARILFSCIMASRVRKINFT